MTGAQKQTSRNRAVPATPRNPDASSPANLVPTRREWKINLIATIIVIGFALSWFYYYYHGVYFRQPYPKNTFLYFPGAGFGDFFNSAAGLIGFNPYFTHSAFPSNYYPFANLQTWLFTLFPLDISLYLFLAIFVAGMIFFCAQFLRTENRIDSVRNVFVFAFLTYPFLFNVDRSNFECLLFVHQALFIYFHTRKQYLLSSIFLSFAVAMKAYPVIFLLLFIADKKFKEAFFCVFAVIALTFAALLPHKGGFLPNLNFVLSGFSSETLSYITNQENIVQRSMSLFTLLKMGLIWSGMIKTVAVASFVKPYYALMCCVAGMIALYVLLIQADLWKKVALLTFAALLFPHVSADYKLIHLFLPLMLFINAPGGFRHDKLFTWCFGLLLIPKSYHYFQNIVSDSSTNDISIAVPINIVIMTWMMLALLAEGIGGLKRKAWVSDWKRVFSEYLGMAKQYRIQLVALALFGGAILFYMKFGMTEYKEVARNLRLSQTLCNERKYSDALDICNQLISKGQGGADAYYITSSARLGLRQWEDAARAAEMALTLAPDYRAAAQNLNSARTALTSGPKNSP